MRFVNRNYRFMCVCKCNIWVQANRNTKHTATTVISSANITQPDRASLAGHCDDQSRVFPEYVWSIIVHVYFHRLRPLTLDITCCRYSYGSIEIYYKIVCVVHGRELREQRLLSDALTIMYNEIVAVLVRWLGRVLPVCANLSWALRKHDGISAQHAGRSTVLPGSPCFEDWNNREKGSYI